MRKQFEVGDRVRTTRSLDREYFWPANPGEKSKNVIIGNDALGVVIDTHEVAGEFYRFICVDFAPTGKAGAYYVDVDDLVLEGE